VAGLENPVTHRKQRWMTFSNRNKNTYVFPAKFISILRLAFAFPAVSNLKIWTKSSPLPGSPQPAVSGILLKLKVLAR
jgi:hypothetical protein